MSRRCQNLYVFSIVPEAGRVIDETAAFVIAKRLSDFPEYKEVKRAIDSVENDGVEISFRSSVKPIEMEIRARDILREMNYLGIYYIDMKYAYAFDLTPDRVVLWADGRAQRYTGHVEFTEDPD